MTGRNLDTLSLETKKTQVFEMLPVMGKIPDVYIQTLSGGTGPFAVEKAFIDCDGTGLLDKLRGFLLSQGDRCAPTAHAWEKAKANKFPEAFEKDYPVYESPEVLIPAIATGNPGMYSLMATPVRKSGDEIISIKEEIDKMLDKIDRDDNIQAVFTNMA